MHTLSFRQWAAVLAAAIGLLPLAANMQAQTYDKLWKRVEQAEQADHPRSALAEANRIISKARAEQNNVQWMRASLVRIRLSHDISPDSGRAECRRLENALPQLTDSALASVGHAMLAHHYATRRADTAAATAARRHARLARTADARLARTPAQPYAALLTANPPAAYGTSLLPAVAHTVCETLHNLGDVADARRLSHDLARRMQAMGLRGGALLVRLDSLRQDNAYTPDARNLLSRLTRTYADVSENVETYLALAETCPADSHPAMADTLRAAIIRYRRMNPRVKALQNMISQWESPQFSWNLDQTLYPGQDYTLHVTARHVNTLKLRFYALPLSAARAYGLSLKELQRRRAAKPTLELTVNFDAQAPASQEQQRSCTFRAPEPGLYYVETSGAGLQSGSTVAVSRLFALSLPDGRQHRISVVDALTGHPVPGATVQQFEAREGQMVWVTDLKAASDGSFHTASDSLRRHHYAYYASTPADRALPALTLYPNYMPDGKQPDSTAYVSLLTDRAVYRPGQTVCYTAVAYRRRNEDFSVVRGRELVISLYDAQRRRLTSDTLITDAMGHASGRFTLPERGLSGMFRLQAPGAATTFRVEAYKRPTFSVELDPVNTAYTTGDTLTVSGRALTFTQQPVGAARVAFTLTRQTLPWLFPYSSRYDMPATVLSDTVLTEPDGRFSLRLPLLPDSNATDNTGISWRHFRTCYTVKATVTSSAGESQATEARYYTAARPAMLTTQWPDRLDAARPAEATVRVLNPSGRDIEGKGRYQFTDKDGRHYAGGTFTTGRAFSIRIPADMPTGRYAVTATVDIAESDTALWQTDSLNYFRETDKRVPDQHEPLFFMSRPNAAGDSAEVFIGSPLADAYVFMDIVSGGRIVESRTLQLNDTVMKLPFHYRADYADGASMVVALVSRGRLHTAQATLTKPVPDKRLTLRWQSFRSRLQPGQDETWTLRVSRPDGQPVTAVLTAALTDKALRQWGLNPWSYTTAIGRFVPYVSWQSAPPASASVYAASTLRLPTPPMAPQMPALNTGLLSTGLYAVQESARMIATNGMAVKSLAAPRAIKYAGAAMAADEAAAPAPAPAAGSPEAAPSYLRTDFAETAFFVPALQSNAQGDVEIGFTLPQSLTAWRFQAIAHDKWMNWGTLDTTVVAQKDFMLQPHLPRFIRQGDHTVVTATLRNLTGQSLDGTATLLLTDAESGHTLGRHRLDFSVGADTTTTLSFCLPDVKTGPLLICRLTAEAGRFADGEEHYLPVLSETETSITATPFSIAGRTDTVIDLPATTGRTDNITVEVAANVLWYALETLPGLTQPRQPDATSLADAAYATALAQHIVQNRPEVAACFRALADTTSEESRVSRLLQRNPDLRQILTAETPWADDADRRAEQLRNLHTLTDTLALRLALASWRDKLAAQQLPDGAWGWFKGMRAHASVTIDVLTRAARLRHMTGTDLLTPQSLERALGWTDRYMTEQLSRLSRKERETLTPSYLQLRYLYVKALLGHKQGSAYETLLKRLEATAHTPVDLPRKALTACILQLNGKKADDVLQSLEELTVYAPEMGRYFDTRRAPLTTSAYRIPSQVAAMEAFSLKPEAYAATLKEMQQWLVQSRRTQGWTSGPMAAEAVYALLIGQAHPAATLPVRFSLERRGRTVAPESAATPQASATLGYVRQDYGPVTADRLRVSTTAEGALAWGAVYATHTAPAGELGADGRELTANVRLEVWRQGRWMPAERLTLHVGDKVRRVVTLTAVSRDFDFVCVSLPRPACLEPTAYTSGPVSAADRIAYQDLADTQTRYFIDSLPKGTLTFAETYTVSRQGTYTMPRCGVSCAYAPEFAGHSAAGSLKVK